MDYGQDEADPNIYQQEMNPALRQTVETNSSSILETKEEGRLATNLDTLGHYSVSRVCERRLQLCKSC